MLETCCTQELEVTLWIMPFDYNDVLLLANTDMIIEKGRANMEPLSYSTQQRFTRHCKLGSASFRHVACFTSSEALTITSSGR